MTWIFAVLLVVVVVEISAFCTSIYLHRCLAHRSLELHPVVAYPMRLHLWLATGMDPKEWVAVHRKHHRYPDLEGDPHSPKLKGLGRILVGNAYYYLREARNPETVHRYAPDIGNDWLDRRLFQHGLVGVMVGLLLFVLLLGPLVGGVAFAAQAGLYVFLSAVINGIGHAIGHQSFDNTATNLQSVAWITAGEGLHNNHHEFPTSARFSIRSGEYDPSWVVIRLLAVLRLARPVHVARVG